MDTKQQGFEKAETRVEEAWRKYLGEVKEPDGWIKAILQPVLIEFSRQAFFTAWDLANKEPCCYGAAVAGNQHSDDCPHAAAKELQAAREVGAK